MYKCKYFKIHELVDPETYRRRGEKAWELLDERMLITLDRLRSKYGKMTVNNYKYGGDRQWSGLRTKDSPYYSPYSQHTFGRAADIIFADVTAEEVQTDIIATSNSTFHLGNVFDLIQAIELGTSWLHFDVRNCDKLKTFTP